jgi:molecular chaperone HscB
MAFDYFELFGLPVSLRVDKEDLRKRFIQLSRQYHPDHFAQDGADVQADILDKAALLNRAYKTLGSGDDLIRYVLAEKGLITNDEKYALSSEFLMEMMDLNEALPEALSDPAEKEKLTNQIRNWQNEIYEPVADIVANYQERVTSEEELLQVKEYYYRKKYLQRLAGQLGQKL